MTDKTSRKPNPVEPPSGGRVLWYAPVVLSGIFLFIFAGLLHLVYRQSRNLKKEELIKSLQVSAAAMRQSLSKDLEYLILLADEYSQGVLSEETFKKQTFRFVTNHLELQKVFFADQQFKIKWVSPFEPHKELVGKSIGLPEQMRVSREVSRSGEIRYTRPFKSKRGHPVIEAYVPVFRAERFLGLFSAVYPLADLLKYAVPESIRTYYHTVFINSSGQVMEQPAPTGTLDEDLVARSSLGPWYPGAIFQLTRYHTGSWKWWGWGLALLALALASAMLWTMMVLRKNVKAHWQFEETLMERQMQSKKLVGELSQSNEELAQFAYVASHDLQEPLHKIRAFSELLMNSHAKDLNPTGLDYLERMHGAAVRMQEMIENLLALSKITTRANPLKKVDLNQVLDDVLSDLELMIQKKEAIVHVGKLPAIEADPNQMNQLFANLIKNALKYHRQGVPPEINIYWEHQEETEPGQYGEYRFCRIYVSDNGIGFEEEYIERIFQPFEQLHPRGSHGGLGIGLAICRKIVRRHGGSIDADSTPGKGSTFFIHLPYHSPIE